jgi:hypothetical protein
MLASIWFQSFPPKVPNLIRKKVGPKVSLFAYPESAFRLITLLRAGPII